MALVFPIRLDKTIFIQMLNGDRIEVGQIDERHLNHSYDFVDNHGNPTKISGYDSSNENNGRGLRLTNLSSIRNYRVMKLCVSNECFREFPVDEFSTRTTNERRDQSIALNVDKITDIVSCWPPMSSVIGDMKNYS